ncbi:hypothetical protein LTR15_007485 [Elasticomyces elasticus]|nr:hypothetical protein LTR15_007485 [Elasticomyces elasticus]
MQTHCLSANNVGHAVFYFSFSDIRKQTYQDLLLSLVVQLGNKEPGRSMLCQAYERSDRRKPGSADLEKILFASLGSYDKVFIHLDGMDECPEGDELRQYVLSGFERLSTRAPNTKFLVTSRDVPDIRYFVGTLVLDTLPVDTWVVDADIQKYVSSQLSRDHKLSRLDQATKGSIEETLAQKADGMFRWVYCQLQLLKQSRSSKPSSIKAALRTLPKDLDETYERMLDRLVKDDRLHALILLRWLAYAKEPLSLEQLAEVSIVDPTNDPTADGVVAFGDRGGWEDTLDILAGFIVPESAWCGDPYNELLRGESTDESRDHFDDAGLIERITKNTKVRLAHFSVKEYLESSRMLTSDAKALYLDPVKEHNFLAQSCLVYLMHYSSSSQKTSTTQDLTTFPMLEYAARTWFDHAMLQECGSVEREVSFLTSETQKRDWLFVYDPEGSAFSKPFVPDPWDKLVGRTGIGTALYYAALLGLESVVRQLLSLGADINAQGGNSGTALMVASYKGYPNIVRQLLQHRAKVNAQGEFFFNALHAASSKNHVEVVQLLLENGADVNAVVGGHALQSASEKGFTEVVQLLLEYGADVNTQGGKEYGNALQAAAYGGHIKIVRLLLQHQAKVNAQGGFYGNALQAASSMNRAEVVQLLLDYGANVNARFDARAELAETIKTLASRIASLSIRKPSLPPQPRSSQHAQGEELVGNAVQAAYQACTAQVSLEHPPDVYVHKSVAANLQAAFWQGYRQGLQLSIDPKINVFPTSSLYGTALWAASRNGHTEIVQLLLGHGADINAQGHRGTPLETASSHGHTAIVQLLLDHQVEVLDTARR